MTGRKKTNDMILMQLDGWRGNTFRCVSTMEIEPPRLRVVISWATGLHPRRRFPCRGFRRNTIEQIRYHREMVPALLLLAIILPGFVATPDPAKGEY